jgi:alpha-tubulin suppressor-like RCC1 family protein
MNNSLNAARILLCLAIPLIPLYSFSDARAAQSGTVVAWGYQVMHPWGGSAQIIAIAAGYSHSVALRSDGTVIAWGDNFSGQSTVPANLSGVTAIAAGRFHSVALRSNGTVIPWGENIYGQSTVPANLTNVIAIAGGGYHSLALKGDGTVAAWGFNYHGQSTVPANLTNVVAIAAGHSHSVALRSNGTVIAWGDTGQSPVPSNLSGVVAIAAGLNRSLAVKNDGTVIAWGGNNGSESTVPTTLNGVVAIAAGDHHSLALKADGTVIAWGENSFGQRQVPANLTDVVAIAGGSYHNLALKADGTLVGWGENSSGQRQVPANLTDVIAIGGGSYHNLALKGDGTVAAWGPNDYGQSTVPANLTDVIAIAAGGDHSLALKSDGMVVAWGLNAFGQSTVPPNLNGIIAIAGGGGHSLALRGNRTVVAWGADFSGESTIPANLTDVIAIAAGYNHSLALKANGTVAAWGPNDYGQSTVPANLTDVIAIAAGHGHSLALKADGTVVAWGLNDYGQSTVPASLSGVIAIAAGYSHSVALRSDGTVIPWGYDASGRLSTVPTTLLDVIAIAASDLHYLALVRSQPPSPSKPRITLHPQNQTRTAAQSAMFSVVAIGTAPLNYQWRKNGLNIPGANTSTLTLNSVTAADSACYSVRVWNSLGSVESKQACLSVLTDGANGTQPAHMADPTLTSVPPDVDSLVLITHGLEPLYGLNPWADIQWIYDMRDAIRTRVPANWEVRAFDWLLGAFVPEPDVALIAGTIIGSLHGRKLKEHPWQHVHLIGHSAGSAVIEAIAQELKTSFPAPVVHMTFLDPYTSFTTLAGRDVYGANANWADNYSVFDTLDVIGFGSTVGKLDHAFNVDVTSVAPSFSIPWNGQQLDVSSHSYPHEFYFKSISEQNSFCGSDYGFNFSKEAGVAGWNSRPAMGNDPTILCGTMRIDLNPNPQRIEQLVLNGLAHAISAGVTIAAGSFNMSKDPAPFRQAGLSESVTALSQDAVWFAAAIPITNAVNFVQFEAVFTPRNGAEGLLSVFWNTNQIGMIDERTISTSFHPHRFALPGIFTNGLYTLSFRLDSFADTPSSITVTNVATGFVGVEQPIQLDITASTNTPPILKLTGAPGFNYLLQSSSNLVDWTPTALLLNTNGTVLFADPAATNSTQRFYRAALH